MIQAYLVWSPGTSLFWNSKTEQMGTYDKATHYDIPDDAHMAIAMDCPGGIYQIIEVYIKTDDVKQLRGTVDLTRLR